MICLSFDTDHMSDERMAEFLAHVLFPGQGTFFCTQRYRSLASTSHEQCPHPYLAPGGDWEQEHQSKRAEFPDALGWRSHSCIFSHLLAARVAADGYRYASTHDDFGRAGLQAHRHCWGVWQMPIYYMDNLDFSQSRFWPSESHEPFSRRLIDIAVGEEGLYVFDFHPIHLMLNTTSVDAYLARRDDFKAGCHIDEIACSGYGVRRFFNDLCDVMDRQGRPSQRMEVVLDRLSMEGAPCDRLS